jgi:hypothetical protein
VILADPFELVRVESFFEFILFGLVFRYLTDISHF